MMAHGIYERYAPRHPTRDAEPDMGLSEILERLDQCEQAIAYIAQHDCGCSEAGEETEDAVDPDEQTRRSLRENRQRVHETLHSGAQSWDQGEPRKRMIISAAGMTTGRWTASITRSMCEVLATSMAV
jgi:hypothetical protein